MKRLTSGLIILGMCWLALPAIAFRIYIDPGHYVGDARTDLEIQTNLDVGLKLKTLLEGDALSGIRWKVRMSREDGKGIVGRGSLRRRAKDANNFEADLFISIHCNGGGGTGTETFWCELNAEGKLDPNRDKDEKLARLVQQQMVDQGKWHDRRVVEDHSHIKKNKKPIHLDVLMFSEAPGCLSEIGFVDNNADAEKLQNDEWQDKFALAYRDAIYEFFKVQKLCKKN